MRFPWAFLAINLEISKRGAGALCMSNNFAENLEVKACFLQEFLRMVKVTENIKILGFSSFFFSEKYILNPFEFFLEKVRHIRFHKQHHSTRLLGKLPYPEPKVGCMHVNVATSTT